MNRTFHVLKTPVYRFDLYGRYQTLWTDDDKFWIWLIWEVPDPVDRYRPFSIPTSVWLIEAYVQIFNFCSSLCSYAIVFTTYGRTDGRTDRHSSNVLEFCADQMSPRNIGSQIIISRCYKRIDNTNIHSLRRVYKLVQSRK